MNRTETLRTTWIPITVRLPPDTDDKVECWNYESQETIVMVGMIARCGAKRLLSEAGAEEVSWDRRISHWRPMVSPAFK